MYVGRWRSAKLSELTMVTIILEELAHCFYRILDENHVKYIVTLLVRQAFSELTLHDLYPGCKHLQMPDDIKLPNLG